MRLTSFLIRLESAALGKFEMVCLWGLLRQAFGASVPDVGGGSSELLQRWHEKHTCVIILHWIDIQSTLNHFDAICPSLFLMRWPFIRYKLMSIDMMKYESVSHCSRWLGVFFTYFVLCAWQLKSHFVIQCG